MFGKPLFCRLPSDAVFWFAVTDFVCRMSVGRPPFEQGKAWVCVSEKLAGRIVG